VQTLHLWCWEGAHDPEFTSHGHYLWSNMTCLPLRDGLVSSKWLLHVVSFHVLQSDGCTSLYWKFQGREFGLTVMLQGSCFSLEYLTREIGMTVMSWKVTSDWFLTRYFPLQHQWSSAVSNLESRQLVPFSGQRIIVLQFPKWVY
jgi:hypothetical protein